MIFLSLKFCSFSHHGKPLHPFEFSSIVASLGKPALPSQMDAQLSATYEVIPFLTMIVLETRAPNFLCYILNYVVCHTILYGCSIYIREMLSQ